MLQKSTDDHGHCFTVALFISSLVGRSESRVARFFLVRVAQSGKMYQMNTKCTKCTQNLPNGHKISQMSAKYFQWSLNIPSFSSLRPSKLTQNGISG
jgi:hypothetical protein